MRRRKSVRPCVVEGLEDRTLLTASTLMDGGSDHGPSGVDVPYGVFTPEEIAAFEAVPYDSNLSTKPPAGPSAAADGTHEANILTFVLDFKELGQGNTSDIFGNTISTFDVTSYGFVASDFDTVADAILAEVDEDYFDELVSTVAGPAGEDLRVDFIIGDIGVAPAGVTEYYYVQIGTGISGPHSGGILGVAGGSVVRNSGGTGPNGVAVGDVVASVFTDAIVTLSGVGTSLTSGNLTATTFGISGTLSHEIGHTVSLSHINKIGSTQPSAGVSPIMGTGAIDLPNADRITDREFSLSGVNSQQGGLPVMHIPQLVDAIGLHSIPAPGPGPGPGPVITGTTFVVNTTTDDADDAAGTPDGLISLREAIIAANTNAAFGDAPAGDATGDSIHFDASVFTGMAAARTIDLDNGVLIVIDDLRITGVADDVILDALGADRAFRIVSNQFVKLTDLTLTNAAAADGAGGGALRITGGGRTILDRVTIENSTAVGRGGGILAIDSTLEMFNSIVRNNTAGHGGGIANILGNVTLNHTLIDQNEVNGDGGGISNDAGRVIARDSVISSNVAHAPAGLRGGGGIHNINTGRLSVSNSDVIGNSATYARGGGIFSSSGLVTIGDSTISTNHAALSGGGMEIVHGQVVLLSSLLGGPGAGAGNTAGDPESMIPGDGGGLHMAGTARVEVEDTLVQFNEATGNGGGLWNSPQGTLIVRGGSRPVLTAISEDISSTAAGLQATVDQFRMSLGADNGGVIGSQGTGRREIDWDDVPDNLASPNTLPADFFNLAFNPLARGVEFSTPGQGFQVSATNASAVGTRFSNINPNYNQSFDTFSPERLFTPVGSNVTVVDFFIPGTNTPAIVRGFGAVFTDVDIAGATTVEFFDVNGRLLLSRAVTAMSAESTLSFLGATFSFPAIAQVRITAGTGTLGLKDISGNGPVDVVVLDDFIYGEPITPESIATETLVHSNIAHGDAPNNGGGGIYNNRGRLAVVDATIGDNLADGIFGSGGGIFSRGGLVTVDDSIISGNDSVRAGGGIEIVSGQAFLTNVTLGGPSASDGNETGLLPFSAVEDVNPGNPGNGGGLHVTSAALVRVTGGSIQNNRAALEGGGLWNAPGSVMVVMGGTQIADNVALGKAAHNGGGGIFNRQGRLIISDAMISDNSAVGTAGSGGGLFSLGGAVTIDDTLFEGNSANRAGGGIAVSTALLTLTNVTLLNNAAGGVGSPGNGGGLHSSGPSRVDVFGGLIQGNVATREGGGLWNSFNGLMILHGGTAIRGNTAVGAANHDGGGGIFNDGGRLAIAAAEISGNMATGPDSTGGGLLNRLGVVTIENSTVSGNMSDSGGGGIANLGTLLSTNNTIVLNIADPTGTKINAGGVYTPHGASTELRNTIVAGNQAATGTRSRPQSSDLGGDGDWGVSRFNLIGSAFTAGMLEDGVNGNIVGVQGVGTIDVETILEINLADNGGPTLTHALTFSSQALNNGSNALALNAAGKMLMTDQRGAGFPRIFNSTVDIGAFER